MFSKTYLFTGSKSEVELEEIGYHDLLHSISKHWMSLEMKHRVSKAASDDFWRFASIAFPKLHRARIDEMIFKKIPQFQVQRLKLNEKYVPPVQLKTGYQNIESVSI